jgi:hypothetical protein
MSPIFRNPLRILLHLLAWIVPPALNAHSPPPDSETSWRTQSLASHDFADRDFSWRFELFYAGPDWFVNALSNPRSRDPFVPSLIYDDAVRLGSANGYVGTSHDVFDPRLFTGLDAFSGRSLTLKDTIAGGTGFNLGNGGTPNAATASGSATWALNPGSGNWNTDTNWTPATGYPNGSGDTATFDVSNTTAVSLSANTEVAGIVFNAGASAYTINASTSFTLTISGAGITNNSGIVQNFVASVYGANAIGGITFRNNATAGINTAFTTNGETSSAGSVASTLFFDTSTAGSGVFTTNGGTANGANGGSTSFYNTSNAGSGTFTTNGTTVSGAFGGSTNFFNTSNAGSGTFTNNGASVTDSIYVYSEYYGGSTNFFDTSSAGSGIFTTNGGTASGAQGGSTTFHNNSTAGDGTFITNGNTVLSAYWGITSFYDNSNAGNGTFITNGATVTSRRGGFLIFYGNSSAANGTFTTNGGTAPEDIFGFSALGGDTRFAGSSTAGNGTFITNSGTFLGAGSGRTDFTANSNAGSATFITNGATVSGNFPGFTRFYSSTNAGSATLTNNAGTVSGARGGTTYFFDTTSASSATSTNNGATVNGAGGGTTEFGDSATAASATLIANAGTNGGAGGAIIFRDDSTGGTATVKVFGNGNLDIRPHNGPEVTVGSLEGSGKAFLGSNSLTVGSNNRSTAFSGVIQSSGTGGGVLTKIGTGTLILSGANTYTGGTKVNGGTLLVDGGVSGISSGTGTGTVTVNNGGTLGGMGAISGAVVVNGGGTLAPGNSPGILHTGALTLNTNGTYSVDLNGGSGVAGTGAGTLYDQVIVNGQITLGGNLAVVIGTALNPGDKFFIALSNTTPVSGTFTNAPLNTFTSGDYAFLVNYADSGGDGTDFNDISLTVAPIPEPSTWIGGGLALVALAYCQRRRFKKCR